MASSNVPALIQVGKASVPEPEPAPATTAAPPVPTAAPPVPTATNMPIAEIVGIAVGSAAGAAVIGGGIAAAVQHADTAAPKAKAKAKEAVTAVEVDIPVYVPIGPTSMRLYKKKDGQVAAAPLSGMFGSMAAFIAFGVVFVSISGLVYINVKKRRHHSSYVSMPADRVTELIEEEPEEEGCPFV